MIETARIYLTRPEANHFPQTKTVFIKITTLFTPGFNLSGLSRCWMNRIRSVTRIIEFDSGCWCMLPCCDFLMFTSFVSRVEFQCTHPYRSTSHNDLLAHISPLLWRNITRYALKRVFFLYTNLYHTYLIKYFSPHLSLNSYIHCMITLSKMGKIFEQGNFSCYIL